MNVTRLFSARPRRRLVAAGAVVALVGVGLSGCTSTLGYAAIVNGATISQSTINQQLAGFAANASYVQYVEQQDSFSLKGGGGTGTYNQAFVANIVSQAVVDEIIHQQLVAAKAVVSSGAVKTATTEVQGNYPQGDFAGFTKAYQTYLISQQARADIFAKVATANVPSATIEQYYQSHLNDYDNEACVRVILIALSNSAGQLDLTSSKTQAEDLKSQLDAGADFATLANKYSATYLPANEQQGVPPPGGVLSGSAPDGCLDAEEVHDVVGTAPSVASLPVNQVTDPVETQSGYYLIELTSRMVEPLDNTVITAIDQQLAGVTLTHLIGLAHVKINPQFGSFDSQADANGAIVGVIPPIVPNLDKLDVPTTTIPPSAASSGSGATSGG